MSNVIRISKKRTHPWSYLPGGASVLTVDFRGRQVLYDRVKDVESYLAKAFKKNKIKSAWVMDGKGNNYMVMPEHISEEIMDAA